MLNSNWLVSVAATSIDCAALSRKAWENANLACRGRIVPHVLLFRLQSTVDLGGLRIVGLNVVLNDGADSLTFCASLLENVENADAPYSITVIIRH